MVKARLAALPECGCPQGSISNLSRSCNPSELIALGAAAAEDSRAPERKDAPWLIILPKLDVPVILPRKHNSLGAQHIQTAGDKSRVSEFLLRDLAQPIAGA